MAFDLNDRRAPPLLDVPCHSRGRSVPAARFITACPPWRRAPGTVPVSAALQTGLAPARRLSQWPRSLFLLL